MPPGTSRLWLRVEAVGQEYSFHAAVEPEQWQAVALSLDGRCAHSSRSHSSHNSSTGVADARALAERVVSCARLLSTGVAGGFTGAYLGPYASSSGGEGGAVADFAWFEYRETQPPTQAKL